MASGGAAGASSEAEPASETEPTSQSDPSSATNLSSETGTSSATGRTASGPVAALTRLSPLRRVAAAALCGGALATSQPPLGFWPVLFVAGPAIFLLWRTAADAPRPGRAAFLTGWGAGAGFFASALHWIVEPFLVDAARHGWMAPFALVILCGGLALFWGAAFWAARRANRVVGGPLALAVFWAGAEFARSWALTGFPWALPAYAWTDTPVAQVSALIGPYGLSALTLATMTAPGALLLPPARSALRFAPCVAAAALLAAGWGWGALRVNGAADATGPPIRILQTDVDQAGKWRRENVAPNLAMLMGLSTAPAAEAPAVIVWPETAVTFLIDEDGAARRAIRAELDQAAGGGRGAALALGALRRAPGGGFFNSFHLLGDGGRVIATFDKVHLVPFGEYMPFADMLRRIGLGSLTGLAGGLEAGRTHTLMTPEDAPPFAPLICYEMIFPRETAAAAEGAAWMTLGTNDGWFGDWAGPAQHLAMAQMRAIETGLPIARAANSGHSAMIDPYGRARGRIGGGRAGAIDRRLPDSLAPPPYRRFGELFTTLLILFILLLSTSGRRSDDP